MKCEDGQLSIKYDESWNWRVYQVNTMMKGIRDRYRHDYLKHPQRKHICGNLVEFHRYYAGINVKIEDLENYHFGGLFNDSSCVTVWDEAELMSPMIKDDDE